jgi:choline dehydrogenase-like flavoprotein
MGTINSLLTDSEFEVLVAVCDALAPPIEGEPHGFFGSSASELKVAEGVAGAIAGAARRPEQVNFRLALHLIENPIANAVLAGTPKRFTRMALAERERVLQGWASSRFGVRRKAFQTLKRLALFHQYALIPEGETANPHWEVMGYPGPVEPHRVPKRIRPRAIAQDATLDADVVVVGSGAGGGVVAAELAAAGQQVIVLEKGGYYNEADFDGAEWKAMRDLYEKRGILTSEDVGIVVLAGSGLGGGTTINWTTSLPTPGYVLQEWERELGVTGATGPEWQASTQAVCERLHVNTDSPENRHNQLLRIASERLGYRWRTLPRNVLGCSDCGYCGYGCRFGAKQGTLVTYLQDAFDHGAQFITECHADRVSHAAGRVTGVEATVHGHSLRIRSPRVVVAAGSVHSPALLKRSGLTNPHIGRHLHLHPVPAAIGIFDEPVRSWEGTMQAVACNQFENLEDGYGFVIEVPPAHPGLIALGVPWRDARSHKEFMLHAANAAFFFALIRDRDGGQVDIDRQGRPILKYSLSSYDARHVIRGGQECVRLLAAAGAHTIGGLYNNLEPYAARSDGDLEAYLGRIERRGYIKNDMTLFSAHQMSSCRMAGSAALGAVNPEGESYEVPGLFVADASALPSATGVNPMISIMTLAHRVAQAVKART